MWDLVLKTGSPDRRDLAAGRGEPESCRNARTQEGFSEQTVRRTEAESGHCGSPCDGTEMYRAG